jgi:hypothetical protein
MNDPRFNSLYLEGQPRREDFRVARERVRISCGEHTLAGDLGLVCEATPQDGETACAPPGANRTYWIQDGEHFHPLSIGVNTIGRLPDNSVVLRDEHVSRRHCAVIIHMDGRIEIHDIASKNGTIVNGTKINGAHRIKPGDQILLCTKKLVFVAKTVDGPS